MLFVHDVHAVIGEREFDFEDAVRYEYAPAVAEDGARLLWYMHATHGAGEAYMMVTVTAVPDGAAWQRLNDRLRYGDLMEWRAKVDAMRYRSTSTLLVQAPWSPLGDIDLDSVPLPAGEDRDTTVFREDVLEAPGIATALQPRQPESADVLECVAAFTPAFDGDGSARILYRLKRTDAWFTPYGWDDWPGSLAPAQRDDLSRSSRMLRMTSWSPLP